jgi:hypothetical protein
MTATQPLFDVLGSKSISNISKIPTPLNCFEDARYISTLKNESYSYTR